MTSQIPYQTERLSLFLHLCVIVFVVLNLQPAFALEPGFYDSRVHKAECAEISAFWQNSKRIVLDRDLRMTINTNGYPSESRAWSETFAVLRKDDAPQKKLSIYFQSPYGVLIPKPTLETYVAGCNHRVQEMKRELDGLGYEQILIYTVDPNYLNPFRGYYLLAHFKYPEKSPAVDSGAIQELGKNAVLPNSESTKPLQSRFYDIKKDNAQCTEIRKFMEGADQRIRVNGYTFLTMSLVGLNDVNHENLSWTQVQKILEFAPKRNTLSIFFESPYGLFIPMPSMKEYVRGCKELVKVFRPGLDKLGFNRILVTTEDIHYYNSPFKGYFVLADIRDPKMEQQQKSAAPSSTNESDVEALEPKFYDLEKDSAQCIEIKNFRPDLTLQVNGDRKMSMSICNNQKYANKKLSWSEIYEILKKEPRLSKLEIFFETPYGVLIPAPPMEDYVKGCNRTIQEEFKPKLDNLGLSRVLIWTLDIHHLSPIKGYWLLADFKYPNHKAQFESQRVPVED